MCVVQVEVHARLRLGWTLQSRTLVRRLTVRSAAREALACATQREGFKKGKYGPACDSVAIEFIPAVFETFGACGPAFAEYFRSQVAWMSERVGDHDPTGGGFTASTFSSWWQQRISVALQLGKAV